MLILFIIRPIARRRDYLESAARVETVFSSTIAGP
jgi:hypothetical protein